MASRFDDATAPISPTPSSNGSSNGSGHHNDADVPRKSQAQRVLSLALKVVGGIVVASTFAVWVYGFSGQARRTPPDRLDDPTFAIAAEQICADTVAELELLPGARDALDGPDRSRQVETSTARYEAMLDELDTLVGGSDRDIEITTGWLADWRVTIQDRYRYAAAVAEDELTTYLVTDTGANERLNRRLTRLADTNRMSACGYPGDLG